MKFELYWNQVSLSASF